MVLPCLVGVFNSIGGSCLGLIGESIKTESGHLIAYSHNIEDLKKQVKNLSDAIESLKNRIEDAANNEGATLVNPVVTTLLERMASLKEEASKIIIEDERSSDSKCLMGFRPNLWACYLTSKSAKISIDEAAELLEKETLFDRPVANVDFSKFLGVRPIPEFEDFESRVLISNQIVAALKDPSVNMVGLYGMGGAGKTTLAEKIGAVLQLDSTFNYVVLATVSEKQSQHDNNFKPDLLNIQKQIAEGFKIQLQGETLKNRAIMLDEQLQKKDKVLIILDDIWSGFELKDVGISIGNANKKFKILMTSRSQMVLRKEMNSTSNFGVDSLTHRDSWILFERMVGGHLEYSNWRPTAEQVVKQCGGVPIILITIAKALRNEALESWEDALTQLKQFDGENIIEAYKMIEVSYKFLKIEEKKKLLLLCAQLNHRAIAKDNLLRYAMGLNLFKGCKTLKEFRNRLHRYLSDLKGCCLLQDGNEQGMVKMHDVVHKFASSVALKDHHVFSVADGELHDWPSKNELEHLSAISLPYCHLPPHQMLPSAFDNPKLESFLMLRSEIDASFQIPENFFAGMKGLKLMDLTRMSLSSAVVSSLGALVKLQTLCLHGCELSDITVIGELLMLQALSLVGSSIILVPKEIGNLGSTLKLLDLRDCEKLEMIASGVIFKLTLLEDLRIGDSCNHWERLEGSHKRSNTVDETNKVEMASMEEFKNLQNLINLEIHIHDHADMFPKDLIFKMLETFKITFGIFWGSRSKYVLPRMLSIYEEYTVVDFESEGTKVLLTRAESLLIRSVRSCVSVSEMDPKGFPELKHLDVDLGYEIQYIVMKNYRNCIFLKLEILEFSRMSKLERICDDHHHPLQVGSFENLRILYVRQCANLKDLFSSYLAKRLLSLKEIGVYGCRSMESIIVSRESKNEEAIIIVLLRVLQLGDLPSLVSLYKFKQIEGHPSPSHLFNKKIMFPELEVLELNDLLIETVCDDHIAITTEGTCWLQNLSSVEVSYCHNLKYVFTSSVVNSLTQLKQLKVYSCNSIEEIVASTERETEEDIELSLPKLDYIKLNDLPNLKRFCHANLLECDLLRELIIQNCSELNTFVSSDNSTTLFTEKIAFPKLEQLKISGCDYLEKVFDVQRLPMNECRILPFQNLQSVVVSKCQSLTSIIPTSLILACQQLEQLVVRNCDKIDLLSFNNIQLLNDAFAKVMSSLKCCYLESRGLKLKYEDQKFKLEIDGSGFEVPPIFFALLQSSPKLDEVVVSNSSIIQLFPCETDHLVADDIDTQAKTLVRVQLLQLSHLSDMEHIWSEHSLLKYHVIPEILEVFECGSLLSLAPPSATLFKNLTGLVVWGCCKLIKLVASSSTAKSLVNLKEMSVQVCESLDEIVVMDDQLDELASTQECIVFDKLEVLKLELMDSLTSFCSTSDCNFRFPSLNRVIVAECPKMKFFCKRDLSTPKLTRVEVESELEFGFREEDDKEIRVRWEGDLNATVRQMSEDSEKKEEDEDED